MLYYHCQLYSISNLILMYPHNFNASNEKYYEPLFNTLEKSRVGGRENQISRVTNNLMNTGFGAQSRITRNIRSLSPQQAQIIRRETIIPFDKELVPTNNLWKVRGKHFTAVDIQVRQGTPIPAEIMRSRPKRVPAIQETVYELKQKNNSSGFRPFSPPVSYVSRTSRVLSPMTQYQTRRVASPVEIAETPTYVPSPGVNFPIREPTPIDVSTRNSKNSNLSLGKSGIQQKKLRSPNRDPIPLKSKKKNKYKYNLFSAFDELVNSGCNTCGSNEIVAKKPENENWS